MTKRASPIERGNKMTPGGRRSKERSGAEPFEETTVVQCEGMLPLPPRILRAAGLHEGSVMHMTITDHGILLRGGRPSDSRHRWSRAVTRLLQLQEDARAQWAAEGASRHLSEEEFFQELEQLMQDDADV